jgi:septal ring factor EnvC (AmiA/AmiB activator)
MTYILGIALAGCVPVLLTLAVLYVRAGHQSASERLRRGEAELALARRGAELRASQEQRERLARAVARYAREIREIEEECINVGDADAVRRRLSDLLQAAPEGDQDPVLGTSDGPVPTWATAEPDSDDRDG